jgi:hypothetical protein
MKRALPRRKPVQRERREQSDVAKILAPVSDKVYTLGTSRIWKCFHCGEPLARAHMTTRQTPGISDVYAFLKAPAYPRPPRMVGETVGAFEPDNVARVGVPIALWVEVKAPKEADRQGGRSTDDQKEFAALCEARGIAHVTGGANDVIAFLIEGGWVKESTVPHYRLRGPFFNAPSGHGR